MCYKHAGFNFLDRINKTKPPQYTQILPKHSKQPFSNAIYMYTYLAEVAVAPLLEVASAVASHQLHIAEHDLEGCRVDGCGEVHVQLVHRRLHTDRLIGRRKQQARNHNVVHIKQHLMASNFKF